jgi:hypothetical protein
VRERVLVQARATWELVTPSSSATAWTALATARRSCSLIWSALRRLPGLAVPPVYLPDRTPPPSGLHAATAIPKDSAMGSSSVSMSRLSRL